MDAPQVADMFGVMAIIALAGVAIGGVVSLRPSGRAQVRDLLDEHGRLTAWSVAVVATAGSLWFSEVANFVPCQLCWYQRIAMYPLVVVLGVRAFRSDTRGLRLAALGLVAAGLAVNIWHVTIETWPSLESGACDATVPCTLRWVEGLGFFTIPRLATVSFLLVGLAILLDRTDARPVRYSSDNPSSDRSLP